MKKLKTQKSGRGRLIRARFREHGMDCNSEIHVSAEASPEEIALSVERERLRQKGRAAVMSRFRNYVNLLVGHAGRQFRLTDCTVKPVGNCFEVVMVVKEVMPDGSLQRIEGMPIGGLKAKKRRFFNGESDAPKVSEIMDLVNAAIMNHVKATTPDDVDEQLKRLYDLDLNGNPGGNRRGEGG